LPSISMCSSLAIAWPIYSLADLRAAPGPAAMGPR
jgi:hypothetical protein